jgi:transcription initiation factor TFIIB
MKCPTCGSQSANLDEERAELVCDTCGLVLEEAIPTLKAGRPEFAWDEATRQDQPDRGLRTFIDARNLDAHGNRIPNRNVDSLRRLRAAQNQRNSVFERGLGRAFRCIRTVAMSLQLDHQTRSSACYLYRRWAELSGHGRQIRTYATAALLAACRQRGIRRPVEDFAAFLPHKAKVLRHAYWTLVKATGTPIAPAGAGIHLPRLVAAVPCSPEVQKRVLALVRAVEKAGVCKSSHPAAIAAACFWLEVRQEVPGLSKLRIAGIAGVTDNTLRLAIQRVIRVPPSDDFAFRSLPPPIRPGAVVGVRTE